MQNFNAYGCTTRCLIEMANRQGRSVTEQELLQKFGPRYAQWLTKPGIADVMIACEIAREMGLAARASVSVDPRQLIELIPKVAQHDLPGILIFRERDLVDGQLEPSYHTMLLISADAAGIKVWNPQQNGFAVETDYTWKDWHDRQMSALFFFSF